VDGPVAAAGGQQGAVGVDRDGFDLLGVGVQQRAESDQVAAVGNVPQLHVAGLAVTLDEQPVVRGVGQGAGEPVVVGDGPAERPLGGC
jgi:hypothetical protein